MIRTEEWEAIAGDVGKDASIPPATHLPEQGRYLEQGIMSWNPQVRRWSLGSAWGRQLGLAGLVLAGCFGHLTVQDSLHAQEAPQSTIGGFRAAGHQLPERIPLPPRGDKGVDGFVQDLNNHRADSDVEVVLGRPRILTLRAPLGEADDRAQISIGDPSVADVTVLSARQLRIIGTRAGITDLVITTPKDESYVFRIFVVYDLDVLRAQLKAIFPDASLRLAQIREHVVIEGEARDTPQVARILQTVRAYLTSMAALQQTDTSSNQQQQPGQQGQGGQPGGDQPAGDAPGEGNEEGAGGQGGAAPEGQSNSSFQATIAGPQLINLIRVPGPNQVMLKVRIAELNRTALRNIGANFSIAYGDNGNIFNQLIGGSTPGENGTVLTGIMSNGNLSYLLTAFKTNNVLKVLAEPNLVTMSGHQASFLAGGEFPYPVAQAGGGAGVPTITVVFREFGVRLSFLPFVLDHERIRLTVVPEVSQLDPTNSVTVAGTTVPGLIVRRSEATLEMRQGQSLAMAGLLQVTMTATTTRIPIMGDLPYIGTLFRNDTKTRTERELLVLVTPYLVEPMNGDQVALMPGDDVFEPNELEFFLMGRIEGRTGRDARSTTKWDDPLGLVRIMNLERRQVQGKSGFSQ